MCYLKEMNIPPPSFLRVILKEAKFSDVSSQNDKPAQYICIILGMFYWLYPLNLESQLIFLVDLQKVQRQNISCRFFCHCCAKFHLFHFSGTGMLDGACLKVDLSPKLCLLDHALFSNFKNIQHAHLRRCLFCVSVCCHCQQQNTFFKENI